MITSHEMVTPFTVAPIQLLCCIEEISYSYALHRKNYQLAIVEIVQECVPFAQNFVHGNQIRVAPSRWRPGCRTMQKLFPNKEISKWGDKEKKQQLTIFHVWWRRKTKGPVHEFALYFMDDLNGSLWTICMARFLVW